MYKIERILREFKEEVQDLYGNRLKTILLYGSWARGDAGRYSDIDVAVVLKGDVAPGKEIDKMIDTITEINMKYNVLLSVYPVSETTYNTVKSPLLLNIQKEGMPL
ncbi:MAG: nucleotidyltransferase domain-containing protein [Theionarchaea archaeon]|nr:MAG: hypothetical protein AYK19_04150 [Theionarchaea archaeon DG-70-1]MBU7026241.1 nucleotidyltransferase domain-containing protein [Theionarchaea archaeon]